MSSKSEQGWVRVGPLTSDWRFPRGRMGLARHSEAGLLLAAVIWRDRLGAGRPLSLGLVAGGRGAPCLWAPPAGRRTGRTGGSHRGRSAEQPPRSPPGITLRRSPGEGAPGSVSRGCCNEAPLLGAYGTGGISLGSEGHVSEVKAWAESVTGDGDFRFRRLLLVSSRGQRERESSRGSF